MGEQRAQTALVLADTGQVRKQLCRVGVRRLAQQAVQQGAYAQHAFAQLAQPEHQVHRDAMRVQVRVDGGRSVAAGVELGAEMPHAVHYILCRTAAIQLGQPGVTQRVKVGRQGVEGAGLQRRGAHAQADLG